MKTWGVSANANIMAIGLGGLQAVALSFPINGLISAALQVLALSGLVVLIRHSKQVFRASWLFSITWLAGSVAWLYTALHVFGQMPAWLSVLAIGVLCGGLALYYSCALWAFASIEKKIHKALAVLLFASAWTLAELARAQWFTGFPWAAIGYAQINSHLSLAAPLVGVYGVGFLSACLAAGLAWAWQNKRIWKWLVVTVLLLVLWPVTRQKAEQSEQITVRLLQANIPQDEKYAGGKIEALKWYKEQLLQSPSDLTVLPETAVPYFKTDLPDAFWSDIEQKFKGPQQAAIIGIPTKNNAEGYGNSAMALGMTQGPLQYDKHHLVPFGEFTPDSFKWINELVNFGMTDFKRGTDSPMPFEWNDTKLSVNICYEDLFGEELARRFVTAPDKTPDVLVNISNLGWFGDNYVVDQHLQTARMRSLEFNRATVRATNSGGTAIINAQGVITDQLPPYTRGVLNGQVAAKASGITPFAWWSGHWGLKPLWAWCLAIFLVSFGQYKWRTRKISLGASVK